MVAALLNGWNVKHKMNKISGYYEGPDGVFYDFKHDEIFELEFEGMTCFRKDVGSVGKFYNYKTCISKDSRKTILSGMGNVIRLGEL